MEEKSGRRRKKRLKKEDDDDFASFSEDEEELDNSNADDMNTSEETVEADELRDLDVAEDSDSNEEESEHEINPEAGESAESEGDLSSEVEEEEDDDDDDDDEEEDEEESKLMKCKPRHSTTAASFKEWAEQQVRIMEGETRMFSHQKFLKRSRKSTRNRLSEMKTSITRQMKKDTSL